MELQQYIQIVLKRWWLIALTTVLAAVAAAGVSYTTTPIFTATATLMVDTKSDPYEAAYWTNLNAQATAGAYAVQATSPVVAARTASRMPGSMTAEEVQGAVRSPSWRRRSPSCASPSPPSVTPARWRPSLAPRWPGCRPRPTTTRRG